MNVIDSFRLTGKVALVTGGSGLYGRQVVEAIAEAGAKTFMASRDLKKQEETAAGFRRQGLDVTALRLDQGEEQSIREVLKQIIDQTGGVDVLVNNAVVRPMKDWSDTPEAFAESMRVNATGMFMMNKFFGEHMAERGHGSIVNIGSMQGVIGPDFTLYEGLGWGTPPDYFFHKGGLIQLTRFAASKLGPRGVRVNVICPGGFYDGQDERFVKRYNVRTFLGRMANATDLKGPVVFLASDASAYVTGATLMVDAGYTAK